MGAEGKECFHVDDLGRLKIIQFRWILQISVGKVSPHKSKFRGLFLSTDYYKAYLPTLVLP